jgi:SAM-dependent methyltransferase
MVFPASIDERLNLIRRCVDCKRDSLKRTHDHFNCELCGRTYNFDAEGILVAIPINLSTRMPKFYQSRLYKKWMAAWEHMIDQWVIYERALWRFFSMSGHRQIAKKVAKELSSQGPIVDLGCGHGKIFDLIDPARGIGVDSNYVFLKSMKKRYPSIFPIQADITNTPFATQSVDCITSLHVLEHLYFLSEGLEEIQRILAPSGRFFFTIPTEGGWGWELGRKVVTGPRLRRRYGLDVQKVMAIEHLNDAKRVMRFLEFYFDVNNVRFSPFAIPILSINSAITGTAQHIREGGDFELAEDQQAPLASG